MSSDFSDKQKELIAQAARSVEAIAAQVQANIVDGMRCVSAAFADVSQRMNEAVKHGKPS